LLFYFVDFLFRARLFQKSKRQKFSGTVRAGKDFDGAGASQRQAKTITDNQVDHQL
jgi:hypothetical protein